MDEPPDEELARWEASGAHWRVLWLTEDGAEVERLSCLGEPVDVLRRTDPALLAYLRERPSSEDAPWGRTPG